MTKKKIEAISQKLKDKKEAMNTQTASTNQSKEIIETHQSLINNLSHQGEATYQILVMLQEMNVHLKAISATLEIIASVVSEDEAEEK